MEQSINQIIMSHKIDFASATHELKEVMFPVKLLSVFARSTKNDSLFSKEYKSPDHKALFNDHSKQIISIVTNNYRLVTNQEALEIGKVAYVSLFPSVKKEDLVPFKVITTKKLSQCHIDLIHKDVKFDKWEQDTWLPFLRVSNSYNRTTALSFELGFVRELCSNGFIFDKKSVKVKYPHTKGLIPPTIEVDITILKKYEIEFVNYINNLKRFFVDEKYVFPLVLKSIDLNYTVIKDPNTVSEEREYNRFQEAQKITSTLTKQYYEELNPTAYAVLNIITDIISHQQEYNFIPFYSSRVNDYYKKPGSWMSNFVDAIQKSSFDMESYLGNYCKYMN